MWKRRKRWMPKNANERVGKVGVWKRLDLASLKRTKGAKAKRGSGRKVEGREGGGRGVGTGVGRRDKTDKWECGTRGIRRG